MKKIIVFLSCLLLLTVLSVPVLAAGSASIGLSADKASVSSGDTVTVTVSASVDSCGSGGVELSYDSGKFSLVSGEWLLSGAFMTDFSAVSGDGVFAFESAKGISGSVFRFVLKVKDNAGLGNGSVSVSFKADSLSAAKSLNITVVCAHVYSDSCDTSCNRCGAGREITHSWNSGTITTKATCTSTGTGKFTCTVCGVEKTETLFKASHQYNNRCDTNCNVCGATRSISHDYVWNSTETEHWKQCSVCGEKTEQGTHTLAETISAQETLHGHLCSVCGLMPDGKPHTYENDCDTDCSDCGFVRAITHSYSERWEFDAGGHWHTCSICGDRLEKTIHTPGEPATESTDQICTTCGMVIETAGNHVHTMAGDWLSDDKGHWFLCHCSAYTESTAHTWDDGNVDEQAGVVIYRCTECGHVKNELYIPEPTEPAPEPAGVVILRWAIPIGLGASLILNVVLAVCLIIGKSRKKAEEHVFRL